MDGLITNTQVHLIGCLLEPCLPGITRDYMILYRSDPTAFGRTTVETSDYFLFTSMYYIILYRECVLLLNRKQSST